jgi:hypothetical protein
MRPRFSLRWLLIAFTLLAVAFYLCFVRPTVIAKEFVNAVNMGGESRDSAFTSAAFGTKRGILPSYFFLDRGAEAHLIPRTWSDIWRCQRRIGFMKPVDDRNEGRIACILSLTL